MKLGSSRVPTWAWIVLTVVIWPAWHWAGISLTAYPLSWFANLASPTGGAHTGVGGIFDHPPQVIALALVGLAFGLVGISLLRLIGAPRIVWLPAAIVSIAIYLVATLFWVGFSGSGTGLAHQAGQFGIAILLGAMFGVGAWAGSRRRARA